MACAGLLGLGGCGGSGGSNEISPPAPPKPKMTLSVPLDESGLAAIGEKVEKVTITLDGKDFVMNADKNVILDYAHIKDGFSQYSKEVDMLTQSNHTFHGDSFERTLKQDYATIMGVKLTHAYVDGVEFPLDNKLKTFHIWGIAGETTPLEAIPTGDIFNYKGQAFNEHSVGSLSYWIDFDNRTGNGEVTGLNIGDITLLNAPLKNNLRILNDPATDKPKLFVTDQDAFFSGVVGKARHEDGSIQNYTVAIYGPQAQEIAGIVGDKEDIRNIGFAGKKQ